MNNQLREAWAILTADRRKAAVLGALVFIAAGLWLRAAITSGPSKAKGFNEPRMTESGNKSAKKKNASSDAEEGFTKPPRVINFNPPSPLVRDLFILSDELLASSPQTEPGDPAAPKSASGTDDKPVRTAAPPAQTVEQRIAHEAAALRLRSTMIGANPIAVIESADAPRGGSSVVRLGETIAGFTLIAVRAHEVELEKENVRVTIARSN